MPQQLPGTLTPTEAWPLTVYLLQANNALLDGVELTPDNAVIRAPAPPASTAPR